MYLLQTIDNSDVITVIWNTSANVLLCDLVAIARIILLYLFKSICFFLNLFNFFKYVLRSHVPYQYWVTTQ